MSIAASVLLLLVTTPNPRALDQTERAIRKDLAKRAPEAVQFVENVARINSGTLNPSGVQTVGSHFEKRLKAIGFETEWIEMPAKMKRGGHLFARRRGKKGKRLLLIGHLDTVFEPDDPFQAVAIKGDTMTGPGVFDMKGGDVAMVVALEALAAAGALDDTTITVALIGDEEKVGSPRELARRDLIAAAKKSDIALGFEPGLGDNHVSIARRGSSGWRLTVEAKGGHSSMVGNKRLGHGAIYETARFLEATRKLFAKTKSLTINPGLIVGGTDATVNKTASQGDAKGKNNKIAARVEVSGDLRFLSEAEKNQARTKMKAIVNARLPHTTSTITFTDGYPAMPPTKKNREVFQTLDTINRALGRGAMVLVPPEKRGAADISFVAPYVAALAGLGPSGSGSHTRKERMNIPSLAVATQRAALLIYRLTR